MLYTCLCVSHVFVDASSRFAVAVAWSSHLAFVGAPGFWSYFLWSQDKELSFAYKQLPFPYISQIFLIKEWLPLLPLIYWGGIRYLSWKVDVGIVPNILVVLLEIPDSVFRCLLLFKRGCKISKTNIERLLLYYPTSRRLWRSKIGIDNLLPRKIFKIEVYHFS